MPPKRAPKPCPHAGLLHETSEYAAEAGYVARSQQQLADIAEPLPKKQSKSGKAAADLVELLHGHSWAFPAPLVLPDDDLALNPRYPPQNVKEWEAEPMRNRVSKAKQTIYLCAPPKIANEVAFMRDWSVPSSQVGSTSTLTPHPEVQDVVDYLAAFYHGLPVKLHNEDLRFVSWEESPTKTRKPKTPKYVGLATSKECVRIRVRKCNDGAFAAQLNLNDILDAVIALLPKDAYAVMLLVEQDMYEHDDDDFCCGRAYGGSRVAVVSSARYNPAMDEDERVDREHAWPASHCRKNADAQCDRRTGRPKKKARVSRSRAVRSPRVPEPANSPLHAALRAHITTQESSAFRSLENLVGLWLGRICKTASHELGHCFGMDHCVCYACIMQATTSLAEDARQPPYLCPVDQTKVLVATGGELMGLYKALARYCEGKKHVELFAAFGAWLEARLSAAD